MIARYLARIFGRSDVSIRAARSLLLWLNERVDTASLRRFTFHIVLGFLDRPGLRRAWQVFFAAERVPADGLLFENLTPGDFVKVRKQAEVLDVLDQPERLVDVLADISRAKPDTRGSLGFVG